MTSMIIYKPHRTVCVWTLLTVVVFVFSEPLLAGLPQMVKFTLLTGHYAVKKGDALQLSNTDTMPILPSTSCTARITNPAAGQYTFERLYLNPPIAFKCRGFKYFRNYFSFGFV